MPLPIPGVSTDWGDDLNATLEDLDNRVTVLHEAPVNLLDPRFGPVARDASAPVSAQITAAIEYAHTATAFGNPSGAELFIPRGAYLIDDTLPWYSKLNIIGEGREATILYKNDPGPMFQWDSVNIEYASMQRMTLINTGGVVLDMYPTGGMVHCILRDMRMTTTHAGSQIVRQISNGFIDNLIDNCVLERSGSATVPGWEGDWGTWLCNGNTFNKVWAHSWGATTTPFFSFVSNHPPEMSRDIVFRDIIGEQSAGGLIHLEGFEGVRIEGARDWDWPAEDYTDSLFKFVNCRKVIVDGAARDMDGTLAAGVYDIDASDTSNAQFHIINCDPPGAPAKLALHPRISGTGYEAHDTGWRQVNALVGTDFTAGASGLVLRRQGSRVAFNFNLSSTSGTDRVCATLPDGFRPAVTMWFPCSAGATASVAPNGEVTVVNPPAAAGVIVPFEFSCDQAWPTALPGSAAV